MGLSREQAMDKAIEIVGKLSEVPMKSNGYAVDGYKPPTLQEKTTEIIRLAEFLWEPEPEPEKTVDAYRV